MIVEVPVMLSHTFCMTIKCIITVQLLVEKPPKTSIQVYNKDASGHPHQQKTFYAYLYDKSKNDLHFWCIEKPPKKNKSHLPSLKLTNRTWKCMVGTLVIFLAGGMLLSGSVGTFFPLQTMVIPAFKAAPSAGIGLGGYASSSLGRTIP